MQKNTTLKELRALLGRFLLVLTFAGVLSACFPPGFGGMGVPPIPTAQVTNTAIVTLTSTPADTGTPTTTPTPLPTPSLTPTLTQTPTPEPKINTGFAPSWEATRGQGWEYSYAKEFKDPATTEATLSRWRAADLDYIKNNNIQPGRINFYPQLKPGADIGLPLAYLSTMMTSDAAASIRRITMPDGNALMVVGCYFVHDGQNHLLYYALDEAGLKTYYGKDATLFGKNIYNPNYYPESVFNTIKDIISGKIKKNIQLEVAIAADPPKDGQVFHNLVIITTDGNKEDPVLKNSSLNSGYSNITFNNTLENGKGIYSIKVLFDALDKILIPAWRGIFY